MNKLLLILFALLVTSCANESDPEADKANFVRIYDSNRYNTSYNPIDMKQTADGGYLFLASRRLDESNFQGIYIMKVDEFGAFVTEELVDEQYVNPVGELLFLNDTYYFFCMTAVGLQTQLVEVGNDGTLGNIYNVGGSYPTAAAIDGSNFILLGYDNTAKESVVAIVSPNGNVIQATGFSVGAGDAVEEPIINHFLRTGRQFPFQVGRAASGQYFFNGFYNYTFSLVFTDLAGSLAVVQGQQDDGGISRVVQVNGSTFASARFNFGDNYFLPNVSLNTSGISSSSDLGGFSLPELVDNAPVHILVSRINEKEVILYASNTKSGQIGLYAYELSTGKFLGSKYLGFSNPYEINSMINTSDEGLAIGATTYVTGRFPRITLFKLSTEELSQIF
ncbi:MAG TPA: hypothetical protein DIS90_11720 [Cytophagales bacterium]|nr:hypothetical protein [Cytophagales bacterium]HCR54812.1 hypothetical protein [Cytophagales bacterium]